MTGRVVGGRFAYERAIRRSGLPAPARHLALTIATWADVDTGIVPQRYQPSLTTLEEATGMSRSSVKRQLTVLEEDGWIGRERPDMVKARTEHARTGYQLAIPPGAEGARPTVALALGSRGAQARPTVGLGLGPQGAQARPTVGPKSALSPTSTKTEREGAPASTGNRPESAAAQALSLIPPDWQPGPDDIRAAQQSRAAAGWPVLTGSQLANVTRKFARHQASNQRALTPAARAERWQSWAERERPTDTGQTPMLGLLDGGRSDGLWPHEQPAQPPGTPKPPSLAVRMAQLDAAIAADQHTDTA